MTIKEPEEVIANLPSVRNIQREDNNGWSMIPWGQRANEDPSWITKMIETQRKDKGVSVSLSLLGEPEEKFEFTSGLENNAQTEIALNPGSVCLRFSQNSEPNNSIQSSNDSSSLGGSHTGSSRTAGKRRRTKAKRTITSEVLRQHFAGSLKDVARSLSGKGFISFSSLFQSLFSSLF